nr:MAG TPA: hypothetical protein [Caudoviricetes sp.]
MFFSCPSVLLQAGFSYPLSDRLRFLIGKIMANAQCKKNV